MSAPRPFSGAFKAACEAEGIPLLPVRIECHPFKDAVRITLAMIVEVEGRDIAADADQAARGAIKALRGKARKLFKLADARQRHLPGM